MKITFLCRSIGISGGMRAILKYSDLLVERGHDVELTVDQGKGLIGKDYDPSRPLWQPTRAALRFVPFLGMGYLRPSDVTIATSWPTALSLNAAGPLFGIKVYFVQHYESLYDGPPGAADATYRYGFHTITISHWLRDVLLENFGANPNVIITPVDREVFTPRYINRSAVFRIVMFYSEKVWKGFATGLEAIHLVRATGRQIELVLISVQPVTLTEPYTEIHVGKSQSDLAEVYSSCDVYLCASLYEGLGMPGMEAMACGCALITTDTGGSRSYAKHKKTALVVEQGGARGLAKAIIQLFDDRIELQKLQQAGMEKIATFSWDEAAKKFEASLTAFRRSA